MSTIGRGQTCGSGCNLDVFENVDHHYGVDCSVTNSSRVLLQADLGHFNLGVVTKLGPENRCQTGQGLDEYQLLRQGASRSEIVPFPAPYSTTRPCTRGANAFMIQL